MRQPWHLSQRVDDRVLLFYGLRTAAPKVFFRSFPKATSIAPTSVHCLSPATAVEGRNTLGSMAAITIIADYMTLEDVEVTKVGHDLYRLDQETLLFLLAESDKEIESYPRFGDVFRAVTVGDNTVRYEALDQRGAYRHYCDILSEKGINSSRFTPFLKRIVSAGGRWERHMDGCLFIALPLNSDVDLDVDAEVARLTD